MDENLIDFNIVKYSNRKYYVKQYHRYVNLSEIKNLVLNNKTVEVLHKTPTGNTVNITKETVIDALTCDLESKHKLYDYLNKNLNEVDLK